MHYYILSTARQHKKFNFLETPPKIDNNGVLKFFLK